MPGQCVMVLCMPMCIECVWCVRCVSLFLCPCVCGVCLCVLMHVHRVCVACLCLWACTEGERVCTCASALISVRVLSPVTGCAADSEMNLEPGGAGLTSARRVSLVRGVLTARAPYQPLEQARMKSSRPLPA